MDFIPALLIVLPFLILAVIVVVAVFLVLGYIATYLGFTGIMWWAVVIVGWLIFSTILAIGRRA